MKKSLMTPRIASSPGIGQTRLYKQCNGGTIGGGLDSGSSGDPGGGLSSKSGTTYICSGNIDTTGALGTSSA